MGLMIWSVKRLTNVLKRTSQNKFDNLVVISGNRGLGKSTLALKIAMGMPKFNMKRDIIFDRKEVLNALASRKHSVIMADEMINVTHNRDFYVEDQKKLIKALNMYRDSCNTLIACVPNFADLDKQFRQLVKIRIDVVRRGLAVIHTPLQTSFKTDKWDVKLNEKIEEKWVKNSARNFTPRYNKLTTYRGMIKYGALTSRVQRIYDELKFEKRNVVVMEEEEKDPDKRDKYARLIEMAREGKLSSKSLQLIALSQGIRYTSLVQSLNHRLKDEGSPVTLSKLLINENLKTITKNVRSKELLTQNT